MLASFEMHVSFPLVRVCGILFHCMFPDVMPERKREKNRKRQQKEKENKKERKNKRREKGTSLFWGVGVICHLNNFCIFIK